MDYSRRETLALGLGAARGRRRGALSGAGRSAAATRELLSGTAAPLDLEEAAQGNGLVHAEASVVPGVRTRDRASTGAR